MLLTDLLPPFTRHLIIGASLFIGVLVTLFFIANNILPKLLSKENKGNDASMLAHRRRKPIAPYTKFQFSLSSDDDMKEVIKTIKEKVGELLTVDR